MLQEDNLRGLNSLQMFAILSTTDLRKIQHYDDYDGPLISIDTAVLGVKKTGRMVT